MAFSYPIWNDIEACIYKSGKSYGVKNTGTNQIKVGTSAKNSFDFAKVVVTHRKRTNGVRVFVLSVDGVIIKKAVVTKNKKYYDQTHTIKKPLKKIDNYYKSKVA